MIKKFSGVLIVVVLLLQSVQQPSQGAVAGLKAKVFESHDCLRLKRTERTEVFVTVSSLTFFTSTGEVAKRRQLEVNWSGRKPQPGDKVKLYNKDPILNVTNYNDPLVTINPKEYPVGYYRTEHELPFFNFSAAELTGISCLGYWVVYSNNDTLIASSCLRIRPFWMQENKRYLEEFKLSEVMIPGSHDSGSYTKLFVNGIKKYAQFYAYAQEESIFNQLVYGLRYFDVRVGFYSSTKERFFVNHFFYRTKHPLLDILNQVRDFMNASKEIVILDFHNFPIGFNEDVHVELSKLILEVLGPYMIPCENAKNPTFRELWDSGKHLLVAYNHPLKNQNEFLCPEIERAWGNKQTVKDLGLYFKEVYSNSTPSNMWASMAEITPNSRVIIFNPSKGLRVFADLVNRNVTRWFRDLYWQKANIVATDYFQGNNIVEVAIHTNLIKAGCWKKFKRRKHLSAYFGRIF